MSGRRADSFSLAANFVDSPDAVSGSTEIQARSAPVTMISRRGDAASSSDAVAKTAPKAKANENVIRLQWRIDTGASAGFRATGAIVGQHVAYGRIRAATARLAAMTRARASTAAVIDVRRYPRRGIDLGEARDGERDHDEKQKHVQKLRIQRGTSLIAVHCFLGDLGSRKNTSWFCHNS